MKGGKCCRVLVFCDRRDKTENGTGPSAQGVKEELEKRTGRSIEMLVGARRVHEREMVVQWLTERGFMGVKQPLNEPEFLVATSAGEVGADIDADHMVCDLVAWERMIQRLGRVNRRGKGGAKVQVFWAVPVVKDPKSPTLAESRAMMAFNAKAVLEELPRAGRGHDASPGALRALVDRSRGHPTLEPMLSAAATRPPLRPALSRALVDAWSMTCVKEHTGRPQVAPWLRGWVEEAPQTTVVWRTYLPVPEHGPPSEKEVGAFFEAAPPQESEKLDTESYHVAEWLQTRVRSPVVAKSTKNIQPPDGEPPGATVKSAQIIALVLSADGSFEQGYSAEDLGRESRGMAKEKFLESLFGKTVVVDARLCGLTKGLLDRKSEEPVSTADASADWTPTAPFHVRRITEQEPSKAGRYFEYDFILHRDPEGLADAWLRVERLIGTAQGANSRAISNPQKLQDHQDCAAARMRAIADRLGLEASASEALCLAAQMHDEGKRAKRWQRAFRAAEDVKKYDGLAEPLAKTHGPIDYAVLNGYRHEFGSIPVIESAPAFQALPADWRDLVLHIVAAHHGYARPTIDISGCDDGPPSMQQERARAVALRFARLQKRWGPWGLAWWESLLRAGDGQASAENDINSSSISREAAR
jgi:CRISPR-associated endonuclease/helicase Cas3